MGGGGHRGPSWIVVTEGRRRRARAVVGHEGRRLGTVERVRLATWNVNSLKVRLPRVEEWLADVQPDVVCMQETKLADEAFPALTFGALGYESRPLRPGPVERRGDPVQGRPRATSRTNFADGGDPDPDARIISARCGGIDVTSVYVPNGRCLGQRRTTSTSWRGWPSCSVTSPPGRRRTSRWSSPATSTSPRPTPTCTTRASSSAPRTPARPSAQLLAELCDWGLVDLFRTQHTDDRHLQLVGLPRRRLPPGSWPAHRPRARLGARGRAAGVDASSTATPARASCRRTTRR